MSMSTSKLVRQVDLKSNHSVTTANEPFIISTKEIKRSYENLVRASSWKTWKSMEANRQKKV